MDRFTCGVLRTLAVFASAFFVVFAPSAGAQPGGGPRPGYIQYDGTTELLEQLARHTSLLSQNFDVARALRFTITEDTRPRAVIGGVIVQQTPYAGTFIKEVIVPLSYDPVLKVRMSLDYGLGSAINSFQKSAMWLLYEWSRLQLDAQAKVNFPLVYMQTRYTYMNAMAAVYTYIAAAQRIYLLPGCPSPIRCNTQRLTDIRQQRLIRQLTILQNLAFQIRELMLLIRYVEAYNIPLPKFCVERSFPAWPIPLVGGPKVRLEAPFVPFPYAVPNANGGYLAPNPANFPLAGAPQGGIKTFYKPDVWDTTFNNFGDNYSRIPGQMPQFQPGIAQIPQDGFQSPDVLAPYGLQQPNGRQPLQGNGGQFGPQPLPGQIPGGQPNGQQPEEFDGGPEGLQPQPGQGQQPLPGPGFGAPGINPAYQGGQQPGVLNPGSGFQGGFGPQGQGNQGIQPGNGNANPLNPLIRPNGAPPVPNPGAKAQPRPLNPANDFDL